MNWLKASDLRNLILAQFISAAGDRLTMFATFSVLLARTHDPVMSSASFLVRAVISLIFGLISLHFLDRYHAKRLMLLMDVLRAGILLAIICLPNPSIAVILGMQAVCNLCEILFSGSREALFTSQLEALPQEEQNRWVAFDNQLLRMTELMGYGISFIVVAAVSYRVAFALDALSFMVSAAFIWAVRRGVVDQVHAKSVGGGGLELGILSGVRAVLGNQRLRDLTVMRTFFWIAAGIINVSLLGLATERVSKVSAVSVVALWQGLLTVGALAGLPRAQKRAEKGTELFYICTVGLVLMGTPLFGLMLTKNIILSTVFLMLFGFGNGLNSFGVRRIRQVYSEPGTRGRVTAFTDMCARIAEVLGIGIVMFLGKVELSMALAGIFMAFAAIQAICSGRSVGIGKAYVMAPAQNP